MKAWCVAAGMLVLACGAPSPAGEISGASGGAADVATKAPRAPVAPPSPYPRPEYATLSETGLYSAPSLWTIARGVERFAPEFELWADGAVKERFIALPAGTRIDTRDMNHWQFPVGTRFWKEFTIDGRRIETRMIERYGESPDDYLFASFVWNEAGDDATLAAGGEEGVLGTSHRIPTEGDCQTCHHGEPGRMLGFSALQLGAIADGGDDMTLRRLVAEDRVTDPPPVDPHYGIPGNDVERPALGYLHANCGHCHNPTGSCDFAQMLLRMDVDEHVPEKSGLYRSVVGQPLVYDDGLTRSTIRVARGAPEKSAIVERMSVRGPNTAAMPWLATNDVDEAGVTAVIAWILSLGG